jgi:predicted nucleic acid-binding protein
VIHLDTSVLVAALSGPCRLAPELRRAVAAGERIQLSTLVLYEWLRGPRLDQELAAQELLFPAAEAVELGPEEAAIAARLYRQVARRRGREIDLAIAACALSRRARLWSLDPDDFRDLPGLVLFEPG